jgi:hypothetical protein
MRWRMHLTPTPRGWLLEPATGILLEPSRRDWRKRRGFWRCHLPAGGITTWRPTAALALADARR